MTSEVNIDKPQDQQTRVELTLSRIAGSWKTQFKGIDFTQGLVDFFRSIGNHNTLRSYSFSILEFFDWYQKTKHILPTPDRVRRAEAVEYARWLMERERGLNKWRIEQDPARRFDAAIINFVERTPGARFASIHAFLMDQREFTKYTEDGLILKIDEDKIHTGGLARHLSCLVEKQNLLRKPSIDDIRRGRVDLDLRNPDRAGIDYEVDPNVFQYWIPSIASEGTDRSSTVVARIRALSSLWSFYTKQGENTGTGEPLLRFNIWSPVLRELRPQAETQMAAFRAQRTPSISMFDKLLATTYEKTHKQHSLQAAQSKVRGRPVQESIRRTSFKDIRDRALMLIMVQMGLRAVEVSRLTRADLTGDPPILTVRGKRNKKRLLRVPPVVMQALNDLNKKMQQLAEHQNKYRFGEPSRAMQLLAPGAPLIPAVLYWGINAYHTRPNKPLSRQAIDITLRRRALKAGFQRGDIEYLRAHPHGFRHLFAQIATASGTSMPKLQAIMGHSDISVTGRYVEERRPEELIADAFKPTEEPGTMEALERPSAQPTVELKPVPIVPEERIRKPKKALKVVRPEKEKPKSVAHKPVLSERILELPQKEERRGLVGFGEEPAMTETEKKAAASEIKREVRVGKERTDAEVRSVDYINDVYKNHWGEKGKVQQLVDRSAVSARVSMQPEYELGTKMELRGIKALDDSAEFEGLDLSEAEPEVGLVPIGDVNKLMQTFIGRKSGLIWWYGVSSDLRPQLPVMSNDQIGECSTREKSSICESLSKLWTNWYFSNEDKLGPTAASALIAWIIEALDIAAQVEKERELREARWVPPDAPISETQASKGQKGYQREVFREHKENAVVQWFKDVAWRYEVSYGGGKESRYQKVKDPPYPEPPPWYSIEDPIYDLPPSERAVALDWIAAITGQPFVDSMIRFNGVSRRDIGQFLGLMCTYDENKDILAKEQSKGSPDVGKITELKSYIEPLRNEVNNTVTRLTLGRVSNFDIETYRKQRGAARRGVTDEKKRTSRKDSYLNILSELFGDEAARDVAIQAKADCANQPLRGGVAFIDSGRELFRIDGGTIRHTEQFKKRFAQHTGTHSECVGRRIARDLWEFKKLAIAGERAGPAQRTKEMQMFVAAMTGYRVPCPRVMERELRSLLGRPTEPQPVFEAWDRIRRRAPEEDWVSESDFDEMQEEYESQIAEAEFLEGGSLSGMFQENSQARPYKYTPNMRHLMPNPVAMIFAVFWQ